MVKSCGAGDVDAQGISFGPNSAVYFTGPFQGTTTMADQTLTTKHKNAVFGVKYKNQ